MPSTTISRTSLVLRDLRNVRDSLVDAITHALGFDCCLLVGDDTGRNVGFGASRECDDGKGFEVWGLGLHLIASPVSAMR